MTHLAPHVQVRASGESSFRYVSSSVSGTRTCFPVTCASSIAAFAAALPSKWLLLTTDTSETPGSAARSPGRDARRVCQLAGPVRPGLELLGRVQVVVARIPPRVLAEPVLVVAPVDPDVA